MRHLCKPVFMRDGKAVLNLRFGHAFLMIKKGPAVAESSGLKRIEKELKKSLSLLRKRNGSLRVGYSVLAFLLNVVISHSGAEIRRMVR